MADDQADRAARVGEHAQPVGCVDEEPAGVSAQRYKVGRVGERRRRAAPEAVQVANGGHHGPVPHPAGVVAAGDGVQPVTDQRAAGRYRAAEVRQVLSDGSGGEPERGQERGQPAAVVQDLAEQRVPVVEVRPSLPRREQRAASMSPPQELLIGPGLGW
jgi:hypothetical protein